jgi:hypothetical protein
MGSCREPVPGAGTGGFVGSCPEARWGTGAEALIGSCGEVKLGACAGGFAEGGWEVRLGAGAGGFVEGCPEARWGTGPEGRAVSGPRCGGLVLVLAIVIVLTAGLLRLDAPGATWALEGEGRGHMSRAAGRLGRVTVMAKLLGRMLVQEARVWLLSMNQWLVKSV